MNKSPLSRGRRRRPTTDVGRTAPPPGPNGTAQAIIGGRLLRYAEGQPTPIDPNLPTHLLLRQLTHNANSQAESSNAMARELVELRETLDRLEARSRPEPTAESEPEPRGANQSEVATADDEAAQGTPEATDDD